MTDLYLKASTEADMTAALLEAGVINIDGNPTQGVSLDQIGPFVKVTGYDAKGDPIEAVYSDWHTNLRGEFNKKQLALLEPFSVVPTLPYRVWA